METAQTAQRHHWLNTIVGTLDAAFYLTDEEQFVTIDIVRRLLEALNIPDRSTPSRLPAAVALEAASGFYTNGLYGPRESGLERPVRPANGGDIVVSVETWCQALMSMILSAYPDLEPLERVIATKVFSDLLAGIGLPHRAAAFFPDDVVRAYHDV